MFRPASAKVCVAVLVIFASGAAVQGAEGCDRYTVCNDKGCRSLVLVCSRETYFLNSDDDEAGFGEKLVGVAEPLDKSAPTLDDSHILRHGHEISHQTVPDTQPSVLMIAFKIFGTFLVGVISLFGLAFLFKEVTMGVCMNGGRLEDKVAIVTGASQGIGFEIARQLAARGALVVVASSNRQRGAKAAEKIRADTGNRFVRYVHLDLASFASVRQFVEEFKVHNDVLDFLVNNAAVVSNTPSVTEDNLDAIVQINFLGHFLLTNLLEPLLRQSVDPRVVNVSSGAHYAGNLADLKHFGDPKRSHHQSDFGAYADSKLAMTLFTRELAHRWKGDISAYAVQPGMVRTPRYAKMKHPVLWVLGGLLFGKNAWQGSQTAIHCLVNQQLVNGASYANCRKCPTLKARKAREEALALKLWQKSEELVNLKKDVLPPPPPPPPSRDMEVDSEMIQQIVNEALKPVLAGEIPVTQ